MISQNHPQLMAPANEYGCYLMSIAWHLWAQGVKEWTTDLLNAFVTSCIEHDYCTPQLFVNVPSGCFFVGGLKVSYRDEWTSRDYRCRPDELEILRWTRPRPDGEWVHFVAGNGRGVVTYDPWHGGARTVRDGVLADKRIFRVL